MTRRAYLVTYDITDPGRLRRVYHVCRAYGDHIQYSVFRCDLSDALRVRLMKELDLIVNHRDDQVLFFDLGVTSSEVDAAVLSVGIPYQRRPARPRIV